jgi:sarcosine oxidase
MTNRGTYAAGCAVIAAGPWTAPLIGGGLEEVLRVYAQTQCWYAVDTPEAFGPDRFPIFIWRHGPDPDDHFYGFPVVSAGAKMATEQFAQLTDPQRDRAAPPPDEADRLYTSHVRDRLAGLSRRCLAEVTCLYTVTPDFGFVIDRHPAWARVLVASPCSGHGFKHSAAVGEALAEWATDGRSRLDVTPFALARFRPGHTI